MTPAERLEALGNAQARLEKGGFLVVSQHGTGRVNRWTELKRGACIVLIVIDRGQLLVTMRAPGGGDYHVGLWEACLDGTEPALDPRQFQVDVETIVQRWDEFESLIHRQGADLDECLRQMGTFVFFARRERGLISKHPGGR